jgi:hypothetical protein
MGKSPAKSPGQGGVLRQALISTNCMNLEATMTSCSNLGIKQFKVLGKEVSFIPNIQL